MIPNNYNPEFKSVFAKNLQAFLLYKRSIGYKYENESHELVRLDKYFIDENITELTDNSLQNWICKRDTESYKTYLIRNSLLKQFVIYLNRHGFSIPFLFKTSSSKFPNSFTPYIFTSKQVEQILKAADTIPRRYITSNKQLVMPVILRLLYCCGLRITEATSLRIGDLDLKCSTIKIIDSKNHNCRIIPISESLRKTLANYLDKIYVVPNDKDFIFPTKKMEQYDRGSIYDSFREILWRCGIPHGGRGKGPRLHDLRHTFAVHALQKLILEGKDMYLLLPILSTYLGHKKIYATEKYLRLTAEMYPDILEKVRLACGKLLPEVTDYEID